MTDKKDRTSKEQVDTYTMRLENIRESIALINEIKSFLEGILMANEDTDKKWCYLRKLQTLDRIKSLLNSDDDLQENKNEEKQENERRNT